MKSLVFFIMRLIIGTETLWGAIALVIALTTGDLKSLLVGISCLATAPLMWRKHFDDNGTFWSLLMLSVGFGSILRPLLT